MRYLSILWTSSQTQMRIRRSFPSMWTVSSQGSASNKQKTVQAFWWVNDTFYYSYYHSLNFVLLLSAVFNRCKNISLQDLHTFTSKVYKQKLISKNYNMEKNINISKHTIGFNMIDFSNNNLALSWIFELQKKILEDSSFESTVKKSKGRI